MPSRRTPRQPADPPASGRAGARPRRARRLGAAERREAIVAAAAALFAERGFTGSTRALAARLGVTQALLYRYFPTKAALISAVFEAFRTRWGPEEAAVLAAPGLPLAERLARFYRGYLLRHGPGREAQGMRLLLHAALAGIDLPMRYAATLDATVLKPVAEAMRAEAGLPPLGAAPLVGAERELAMGLHGALVFLGIRRHVYRAPITAEAHARLLADIIATYLPGALARLRSPAFARS
ncbi:MAG: helix-turn-helix transcriptional regulator [Alphaproteobacteria bacterium]|nr:helix-turn-helix transcriptional regulator [Alphaproteobacteria bacterium]